MLRKRYFNDFNENTVEEVRRILFGNANKEQNLYIFFGIDQFVVNKIAESFKFVQKNSSIHSDIVTVMRSLKFLAPMDLQAFFYL